MSAFRPGQAEAIVARARAQGRVVAEFGAGVTVSPPPGQHPCAHSWCCLPRNHDGPCHKPISNETDPLSQVQRPKSQRHKAPALGATGEGEKEGVRRARVRFVGYRVRPLDPDNFAGGCKDLLDGLRHAGLIPGDEPWRIIFETEQEKVAHFDEERTVIHLS